MMCRYCTREAVGNSNICRACREFDATYRFPRRRTITELAQETAEIARQLESDSKRLLEREWDVMFGGG